jgi:hypothetical protein
MCGDGGEGGAGGGGSNTSNSNPFSSIGTAISNAFGGSRASSTTATGGPPELSSMRPMARPENFQNISLARQDQAQYVENALRAQGFTEQNRFANYRNVDPVTGETYSPMSPAAREAAQRAEAEFARSEAGRNLATQEAIGAFGDRTRGAQPVDASLVAAATGRTPGLTQAEIAQAQRELGRALGQGALAPNATWDRPLGDLMSPTLTGTQNLLGRDIQSNDYFSNLSRGYNRATGGFFGIGGQDITADPFGNVGFNTMGQRIGQGIVNNALPAVAGMINPALGIAASGLRATNMTPYGNPLLGSTSSLAYDFSRPIQGAVFAGLTSAAAPAIARSAFNGSNAQDAMMIGTVGGMGLGGAGAALAGNLIGDRLGPVSLSGGVNASNGQAGAAPAAGGVGPAPMRGSDIAESGGSGSDGSSARTADLSGFGARVGSDRGDESPLLTSGPQSPGQASMDLASLAGTAGDFGGRAPLPGQEGPAFDPIAENALAASQPTDLSGVAAMNTALNPMFFQAPAGIQFLTQGRQRDTGNVTYGRVDPRNAFSSQRRGSIGNRLLNVV